MVDVTTYGAVGDGFANDTMAIQAAITQAQSQGAAVFFPHGKYRIPSLAAQSGRLILVGFGDATIIGNFLTTSLPFHYLLIRQVLPPRTLHFFPLMA